MYLQSKLLRRMKWEDHLRPGIWDQPGQHSKTSILGKTNNKIPNQDCYLLAISGTQQSTPMLSIMWYGQEETDTSSNCSDNFIYYLSLLGYPTPPTCSLNIRARWLVPWMSQLNSAIQFPVSSSAFYLQECLDYPPGSQARHNMHSSSILPPSLRHLSGVKSKWIPPPSTSFPSLAMVWLSVFLTWKLPLCQASSLPLASLLLCPLLSFVSQVSLIKNYSDCCIC
jgi:hypothetical protein